MGVCRGIIGTGNARSLRTKYIFRVGRGLAPAVNSQRIPRRGQAPALPYKFPHKPQFVILSEVKNLNQNEKQNVRNEILRLTAQNDNRAGEHSSPLRLDIPPQFVKTRTLACAMFHVKHWRTKTQKFHGIFKNTFSFVRVCAILHILMLWSGQE